jgi:hypothetical protein
MTTETSLLSGAPTPEAGTQPATETAPAAPATEQPGGEPQAQAPAGEQPKTEEAKPQGAPEAYEFTMPEGFELNKEVSTEFEAYARELNLPQDKAQAVVDMGVKLMQSAAAKQAEAFAQTQKEWRDAVVNDKELGGAALAENLSYAAKVLDTFAPDLRAVLDQTGLGNHPAFVKAFVKIGKAISEDRLVGGAQQTPGAAQDPAAKLFPTMNQ